MLQQTPCIIFAGGKSSRMQSDKSLLPFGGFSTLCEYQQARMQKIFQKVYIATKESSKFPFKADFITDNYQLYAPTSGFLSIYETLNVERFFVLGVDIPFVEETVIKKLFEADSPTVDATIATTDDTLEPLCGIYHKSLMPSFKTMMEENRHKLHYMLKNSNIKTVAFEKEIAFLNLNKPHEYQKALEIYDIIP